MSLFEFIMVLLSIVVGLGLAKILSGLASALIARRVQPEAWIPLLFGLLVFITLVQVWWESWTLQPRTSWTFGQLLVTLVNPVLLYILAHLVFPPDDGTPLREHYFDRHRLLFSIVVLSAIASIVSWPIAFGMPLWGEHNAAPVVMALGALTLVASANPRLHATMLPVGMVLVLLDIVFGFSEIS